MAKKKDAHHGGAWKVAFADFMTAMMALFLVLWISAQDKEILIATSQYFQSPFNSPMDNTSGVLPYESNSKPSTSDGSGQGNNQAVVDMNTLQALAREFYRLLNVSENDPDSAIDVEVTSNGLRVTLFDRSAQPLFVKDTAEFTDWGNMMMQNLAWLIDRQNFRIVVAGHTRAGVASDRPNYTDWDLSTDQVQAARRLLTYYAVDSSRFEQLIGFGATKPMPGQAPEALRNQRIVLSLSMANRPSDVRDSVPKPPRAVPEDKSATPPPPAAPSGH
ncbi:MAG: flagellar motor protein MotB [Opitutaceae bacterium]|nr:flagellar motor protein MotB [Opitutaceae bacterium]